MLGEGSFEERCAQALTLLLNESGARPGILYRTEVGGLTAVATIDSVSALARGEADTLAQACVGMADEYDDDLVTITGIGTETSGDSETTLPMALNYIEAAGSCQAGVVVLHGAQGVKPPSLELVEFVARQLAASVSS